MKKTHTQVRKELETIVLSLQNAPSFEELTRAERDMEQLNRDAGNLAPITTSALDHIRATIRAKEDAWERGLR